MNPKNQNRQVLTESGNINNATKISNQNLQKKQGNIKQTNRKARYNFVNQKNKQPKNNYKAGYHYTTNNNEKSFNNTIYKNKNDNIKHYNKLVVDMKESIKRGRNTSAPALKKKSKSKSKSKYSKINKFNKGRQNDHDTSINKYNINKIRVKDTSYDRSQNQNKYKDRTIPNRINRINNIKQKLINKTNKKNYDKIINKDPANKKNLLNNTNIDYNSNTNYTDRNKIRKQIKSRETDENNNTIMTSKDILENQEKIAILKKKIKEDKPNMKNNSDANNYTYNNIRTNDQKTIENENKDEKNITIDNEEKIINIDGNSSEENKDDSINNAHNNMENNNYRDITPDKTKNQYNNSYMNNFDSIDTNDYVDRTQSKIGSSYIKDNAKNNNYKKINNKVGYSYNKPSDHVRKINIPKTERDKDLLKNNYNLYSKNLINTERVKNGKKKSKKINIINLKSRENNYYYTKSSNIFNTVNNKLNKSSIIPSNKNRSIDVNKEKRNLNKTKFNAGNNIKKNNSVRKAKVKSDLYNNNITIGKRNDRQKLPNKRQHNRSLNYTTETINSSKVKKFLPKTKNSEKKEEIKKDNENEKPEIEQEPEVEHEDAEAEEENEKVGKKVDNKKIRKIEKIGVICHAGEVSFGKAKTNQDNYFNYNINYDDLVFVGVCDGHGENGHYVSEYLISHLPLDFQDVYFNMKKTEKKIFEDIPLETITKMFEESFKKTDKDLNDFCDTMKKKKIMGEYIPNYYNCDYSGSTCVSLLLKQKEISTVYIANVGDSRIIVIRENENNNWTCEQLSRDHKPTEKDEYQRIIDADGEIEAIEDDDGNWTGPLRVWEKGSEGPGLAMTRSLGDKVGSKIGVVCTPEITKYSIKEEDRAFIIASDGLWEYFPNQDVTEAVKELILDMRENNDVSADIIANELFKQSVIRWRQKEPGMDDITIVCVLLN